MKVGCYVVEPKQRKHCNRWLRQNSVAKKNTLWYDEGSSDEQMLDKLDDDVANGNIDTVVCATVRDIGGRLRIGIERVRSWCEKNTKVVFLGESIELTGKTGRTVANMMSVLCRSEDDYIRERHQVGVDRAKKEGKYKGRPKGITKKKPELALELRETGLTVEQIAEELGVSPRTVFRYLGKEAA